MSTNGVPDQAKRARENLQEVGREAYHQADKARRDAVKQLYEVAATIRGRAMEATGDARDSANRVARNLEQTANFLNSRAIDQMEDTASSMRENVWKTSLVVFLVGFILGILLSRRD